MNFINGIITGIIATLLTSLMTLCIKPIRKRLTELRDYYRIMKGTGLILFLPLKQFVSQKIFETMINEGGVGDEVLVVGRTVRWLIRERREIVLEGIEKGITLKILILNPDTVDRNVIELSPLQLTDPLTISRDLDISIPCFIDICTEAKKRNLKGSFEIRTCNFVVFNSLTAFSQKRKSKRNITLDFSFSESLADKYQQHYECDFNDRSHFCNKLYGLYKGVYDQCSLYIGYYEGQIHRGAEFIKSIITEDVDAIIQKHSGGEAIRKNDSRNFLSETPKLFDAIIENQPPPYPISVQLELTNNCNTCCRHCKRHTWSDVEEEMPTDRVIELLKELAHLRVKSITLSGGEPTLREDFVDILECGHNQGLMIGVLTNGLDIDIDLADAITRYSDWVRVSLDATDANMYGLIRGVDGGFERVLESIGRLQKRKAENHRNCRVGICYSIQNRNISGVPHMIELAERLGFASDEKAVTFKFVHGRNGFLCNLQQIYDFRMKMKILTAKNPGWDQMTNLHYLEMFMKSYANDGDIADGIPLRSYYQENQIRCFTPYLFALIDAFGDVYPCCFLYHDNDSYNVFKDRRIAYRMGRISENQFGKIWHGDKFADIRNDLKIVDVSRFSECKQCTRHYLYNAFLTELLGKYEFYSKERGGDIDILRQVLGQYPPQVLWL